MTREGQQHRQTKKTSKNKRKRKIGDRCIDKDMKRVFINEEDENKETIADNSPAPSPANPFGDDSDISDQGGRCIDKDRKKVSIDEDNENKETIADKSLDRTAVNPDGGDRVVSYQILSAYSFNTTGDGKLGATDISVYCGVYGENEVPHPQSFSHNNILDVLAYDELRSITIYRRRGESFGVWVQNISIGNQPIRTFEVEVKRGSEEKIEISYIPAYFRDVIRGLLSGIVYIHECKFVVKGLNEDNICFVKGIPKYWGLRLSRSECDDSRRENLIVVASLIQRILGISQKTIPHDMVKFLELMSTSRNLEASQRLLDHVSLIPPRTRMSMVCEMYELKGQTITDDLGRKSHNSWWKGAAKKFYHTAKVNDWEAKYASKIIGPVKEAYTWGGKEYVTLWGPEGVKQVTVAADFLNFLRNLVHHIGQIKENEMKKLTLSREQMDAVIF